jgi:hypothetical protein
MNTTLLLRTALLNASVSKLDQIIDFLDRPWAPGKNDALRAAWHEARRSDGARRALAYAIEEEVRSLSEERDLAHVSQRLGLPTRCGDAIAAEIVRRLGGPSFWPLTVSPELIVGALRATADIARFLMRGSSGRRHHRHRSRRHDRWSRNHAS